MVGPARITPVELLNLLLGPIFLAPKKVDRESSDRVLFLPICSCKLCLFLFTPPENKHNSGTQAIEDVSPIKYGDFTLSCLFSRGYRVFPVHLTNHKPVFL